MQLKLIRQALKSLFASYPAVFGDAEERDLLAAAIAGPKTGVISAMAHALIKADGTVIPADQVGRGGGSGSGLGELMMPALSGGRFTLAEDEFSRADSAAGGVSNGWVDPTVSWKITGGAAHGTTIGYNTDLISRPEILRESRVRAVVEYKTGEDDVVQSAAVWIRTQGGAANGYATWLTMVDGAKVMALGKFVAGVPTWTSKAVPSLTAGSFYVLTIEALGSQIRAKLSASATPDVVIETMTLTDTTYPTGRAALSPLVPGGRVNDVVVHDLLTAPMVVCDGNSMTEGYGVSASQAYPQQLSAILGDGWRVLNVGVSAQTTTAMIADAATQIDVLFQPLRRQNVLIAWEITNHLFFGATAEAALAAFKSYCSERRSAGWSVIAMTVTPRSEVGTPSDWATKRAAVNTELRKEEHLGVYWDALYDVAADSRFASELDTTYFLDKVHMTGAGYAVVAEKLAQVVNGEITT